MQDESTTGWHNPNGGRVPDGYSFDVTIQEVSKWGRSYGQLYEAMFARNANPNPENNLRLWKCALPSLAGNISVLPPVLKFREAVCSTQWQSDLFDYASSHLWQLIDNADGKNIKIRMCIWYAITRAVRDQRYRTTLPDEYLDRILHRVSVMAGDGHMSYVENVLARKDLDKVVEKRVRKRLIRRLAVHGDISKIIDKCMKDDVTYCKKYKWLVSLIEVHRRIVRMHERSKDIR